MNQFSLKQVLIAVACFSIPCAILAAVLRSPHGLLSELHPIVKSLAIILVFGMPGAGVGVLFKHPVVGFGFSIFITPLIVYLCALISTVAWYYLAR